MNDNFPLVQLKNLCTYFSINSKNPLNAAKSTLKAVDNVSLTIFRGETLGLVGESGCGKTTLAKTILYLYKPTSGHIIFDGKDLSTLGQKQMRNIRRDMQIVFQDPYSSLNSRMTIGQMLTEPYIVHGICSQKDAKIRVLELLETVGLRSFYFNRYPHELSGGQRQRISIARALTLNPRFIICDEAVSALDVSVQSQIINLLEELKEKNNLTYLFVSHDLNVVRHISDRICVMYLGKTVELADESELYAHPLHPYTQALLSAVPTATLEKREHIRLEGDLPSPINPPSGCAFRTRCKYCTEICKEKAPEFTEIGSNHYCACHNLNI